ncbi:MAG: 4-hydroxy-tetrahydrodipicolinate reductase [Flavobacteriales bacterium]
MKIALIGYGKMGKSIESIAPERGHEVICKISSVSTDEEWKGIKNCDIAIEFTRPDVAPENISKCLKLNIPVVVGTTGWIHHIEQIKRTCEEEKGALLYASNFSLGVNIFFEINRVLAELMNNRKDYQISMTEIHHTEKLDAPSGTAISLAGDIIAHNSLISRWAEGVESKGDILGIQAERIPNVPGTHQVVYNSEIDKITIEHVAHNRKGFALGAIIASEFLLGKQGVYTMKDVLNIKS